MKYKISISKIEYGEVEIEADSEEEVINEAYKIAAPYSYNGDDIYWYDNEISDVSIEKN
mgnify:CR=1 FL=1